MTQDDSGPLRIGVIGGAVSSAIGYTHFAASRMDGRFSIGCGSFSRHTGRNRESAKAYGVDASNTYDDWLSLLRQEREQLDAVAVLTPIPDHLEMVRTALEMGLPVICEKALAASSEDCRLIEQVVIQNQGFLAVTFNYSGYPMVRELQQRLATGELGQLQQIHIEMPQEGFLRQGASPQAWRLKDYGVPTVSLDLGAHVHHLVNFLSAGLAPLEVMGHQETFGAFEGIVDNVYCLARYQQSLLVQSWFGKTALGYRNGLRLRVFGSKASAEWVQMEPEVLKMSFTDGQQRSIDRGGDTLIARQPRYNRFKAGHPSGFIEAFANLYTDIADHIECHTRGQPAPNGFVQGAAQSEECLRFLEAIQHSARTRAWQAV